MLPPLHRLTSLPTAQPQQSRTNLHDLRGQTQLTTESAAQLARLSRSTSATPESGDQTLPGNNWFKNFSKIKAYPTVLLIGSATMLCGSAPVFFLAARQSESDNLGVHVGGLIDLSIGTFMLALGAIGAFELGKSCQPRHTDTDAARHVTPVPVPLFELPV